MAQEWFIDIRSEDAHLLGDSTNDFYFNLGQAFNPRSVELVYASIPRSWYNINSTNNKFVLKLENASEVTITVPEGDYSISVLRTALEGLIDAQLAGTVTISYIDSPTGSSPATNKLTITHDTADIVWGLLFSQETENSIATILGFNKVDYTGSAAHTAPNSFNLTGEQVVNIHTHLSVDSTGGLALGQNNVLDSIPINVAYGNTIVHAPNYRRRHVLGGQNVASLKISVRYPDGRLVDMNGIHWNCKLLFG